VACFSRLGWICCSTRHDLAARHRVAIPSAIFDGEACAGDGHEGIQSVVAERKRAGGEMVLVLFDLLHLRGKSVMRELWRDRRTRLEDLLDGRQLPRVAVGWPGRATISNSPGTTSGDGGPRSM
jgi:ATP-dependent DNA ligase